MIVTTTSLTAVTLLLTIVGIGAITYGMYHLISWLSKISNFSLKKTKLFSSWSDFFVALRRNFDDQTKRREQKDEFVRDFRELNKAIEDFNTKYNNSSSGIVSAIRGLTVQEADCTVTAVAAHYKSFEKVCGELRQNIGVIQTSIFTSAKEVNTSTFFSPAVDETKKTEEKSPDGYTAKVTVEPVKQYDETRLYDIEVLDSNGRWITKNNVSGSMLNKAVKEKATFRVLN